MTSDVNINTAVHQQQQTQSSLTNLNSDFTEFLTLLTTQLQHQDPLNPMDTNEFTNQLVQFSQVEQQINSNQKLDSLVQLQLSNAFGAALGYVGLDINYVSGEFNYDGETPVPINYAINEGADAAQIFILDEKGDAVYSKTIDPSAGAHDFVWDGKTTGGQPLEPGTYQVRVDATSPDDTKVDTSTVVSGRVHGVETQNGQIYLLVGERAVPLSTILKATVPAAVTADTDTGTEGAS